jgi:hypothetical protein
MDCFAALAMTGDGGERGTRPRKILFIIFVDAIFTTLFLRLFTNTFDVIRANTAIPCV